MLSSSFLFFKLGFRGFSRGFKQQRGSREMASKEEIAGKLQTFTEATCSEMGTRGNDGRNESQQQQRRQSEGNRYMK